MGKIEQGRTFIVYIGKYITMNKEHLITLLNRAKERLNTLSEREQMKEYLRILYLEQELERENND